jgi:hypothetical protein
MRMHQAFHVAGAKPPIFIHVQRNCRINPEGSADEKHTRHYRNRYQQQTEAGERFSLSAFL